MDRDLFDDRVIWRVAALLALLVACSDATDPEERTQFESLPGSLQPRRSIGEGPVARLIGAGDIASCESEYDSITAEQIAGYLAQFPDATVFTVGDNAYDYGRASEFANCYDPTWGRFKPVTRPALGNHEYWTGTADAAFDYFGELIGPRDLGYYSYDVGAWHVIVLNSNTYYVPARLGSAQQTWLANDLAANAKRCILAYWHYPRFVSGYEEPNEISNRMAQVWEDLYAAGATLIVNAHDHHYERFAPQDPDGNPTARGIRQFVVGTGGKSARAQPTVIAPNSEVRRGGTFGVMELQLGDGWYAWNYMAIPGDPFTDSGTGACVDPDFNAAPVAKPGGPYSGSAGTAIGFKGTASFDPDGHTPLAYAWDFGDGTTATGYKRAHTYASAGTYTVTLTVTDARGLASIPAKTTVTVTPAQEGPPAVGPAVRLIGAGAIASCTSKWDSVTAVQVADYVAQWPAATVFTVGDNVYNSGTAEEYANCYEPTWGRFKAATRPALGAREYRTGSAAPSFDYFGEQIGPRELGYYSYDLGAWHVIVLNSNTSYVKAGAGSPQETWLRNDLAATDKRCILAYWNLPRFSSSTASYYSVSNTMKQVWTDLYAAGVTLVLNGDDHWYERFAPQDVSGNATARGIRQFIVGTGGKSKWEAPSTLAPNSEVRLGDTYGVLDLQLGDGWYSWSYTATPGDPSSDSGTGACVDRNVNEAPVAKDGGPYYGTVGTAVDFDGSGSFDVDGNTPLTYAWDFGDGTTGQGATTTHTYAAGGAYTVTLTVTDAAGRASAVAVTTATIAARP